MQLEVKLQAKLPDDSDSLNIAVNAHHIFVMLKEYERFLYESKLHTDEAGQRFKELFKNYL